MPLCSLAHMAVLVGGSVLARFTHRVMAMSSSHPEGASEDVSPSLQPNGA